MLKDDGFATEKRARRGYETRSSTKKARNARKTVKASAREKKKIVEVAKAVAVVRDFYAEHKEIFDKLNKLIGKEDLTKKEFCDLARLRAQVGKTVVLFDDEIAKVLVISSRSRPCLDVEKAQNNWPQKIFDRYSITTISIDEHAVREAIGKGDLDPKYLNLAEVRGAPNTPQVKIEIRRHGED